MKSEKDINEALFQLYLQDSNCQSEAHKTGGVCLDVGHGIRGTWRAALRWVLDEVAAPW